MAQEKVSMRKIKEILRLRYDLGLRQDQIARSCNIGQATVHRYLERFAATGLGWPPATDCDEARLEKLLFATRRGRPAGREDRPAPDLPRCTTNCRNTNISRCSWFGRSTAPKNQVAMVTAASVSCMGASSYTFAYATRNQNLHSWIDCHIRAFEFLEGVPRLVIPDNPRTAVGRACRYEPDLNRTYHEMAQHYGVAIMPARPARPRDKAYVSYCSASGACNVENRLLRFSTSVAFENRFRFQGFV